MREPGRLDQMAYLGAGLKLLADRGPGSLTVSAVCNRLRASRGSFYHHFADLPAYTSAVVQAWETDAAGHLDRFASITGAAARYEAISRYCLDTMPHALDAAMRAWGRDNPFAAAAVHRVDLARQQAYADALALFIDDPRHCMELAATALELLIGLQHERPMDKEMYLRVGLEWSRVNVGVDLHVTRRSDGRHVARVGPARPAPVPGTLPRSGVTLRQ